MRTDYIYENAPLIEVIAEIHWELKSLQSVPDAKIDRFYDLFKDQFSSLVSELQLTHIEEIIPAVVPLEILPHKPRIRIRKAPSIWPIAQVGPGIITANIIPPYNGWGEFEPFLFGLIDSLFDSYPLADQTLRIEKLHLRYIDGFDDRFNFENYSEFAKQMLGCQISYSSEFIENFVKKDTDITYLLETRFQIETPRNSNGIIKIAPGKINDADSLILEMHCESAMNFQTKMDRANIKQWFSQAHRCLHDQFEAITTPQLKSLMGERKEIST